MKKAISLLLAFALLFSLASCSPSANGDNQGQATAGKQKVIRIIKNIDLDTMDAQVTTDGLAFEVITSCVDGLYYMNEKGLPEAALAENTEISEDGLTYTFTIREAKWSNGDPVTANDFVFAWRRLADPEHGAGYAYILQVAGIRNAEEVMSGELPIEQLGVNAPDEKTLVVELDKAVPFFLSLTSFTPFFPANEKFVKEKGAEYGLSAEATISNGPFKMVEWNQGASWKLVKNPDYYDADKVKLDAIEYKFMGDAQSAVLEYESGNADYVKLTGDLVERYKNHEHYSVNLGEYLWFLSVNILEPTLANEDFSMALKYAFDRKQIAENVLKDGSIPAYGFVPLNMTASPEGDDFRATNGDLLSDDKELAKEYWAKAKEELGDEVSVELLFEDTEQSKNVAEFIKSELESTLDGLTVNLKSQPKKTRLSLMKHCEYELGLTRWGPDYQDPMTYLDLFMENGMTNYAHWKNDKYESLMRDCLAAKDEPMVRWNKMLEAEKILMQSPGAPIPVYQVGDSNLWNPKIVGVIKSSVGVKFKYKFADIVE